MHRRLFAALLVAFAACRGVPPATSTAAPAATALHRRAPAPLFLVDAGDPAFWNPREVGAPMPVAWGGSPAKEIPWRLARLRRCIDSHRDNMANVGTVGHKALDLHGTRATYRRSWKQGPLEVTERQLDLAIDGDGFFRVTLPDGTIAYTRDGNFQIDAEGNLTTVQGFLVDPNQTFPENMVGLTVSRTGQIFVIDPANPRTPELIGQLELARFVNPSGLRPLQEGLSTATAGSGNAIDGHPGDKAQGFGALRQGYLESSNVETLREAAAMEEDGRAVALLGRLDAGMARSGEVAALAGGPAIELEPGCVRIDTRLVEVDDETERWLKAGGIPLKRDGAWFVIERGDSKKLEELLRERAGQLRRCTLVHADHLSTMEATSTGEPSPDCGTVAAPNVNPLMETVGQLSDLRSLELVTSVLARLWVERQSVQRK